jgi:hypothetical protein
MSKLLEKIETAWKAHKSPSPEDQKKYVEINLTLKEINNKKQIKKIYLLCKD